MKRLCGSTIILLTMGFWSIEPRPTASQPGAISTKTSIPFNKTPDTFWILKFEGFKEDKLIVGKLSKSNFVTNQKSRQRKTFDSQNTGRFKVTQPPSCVHLTKNLFIDEAEIANIDYQEFLFYLKRDSTEEIFNKALPQTRIYDYSDADYFASPRYRYFPMVGLTHDQAKMYCEWRSRFVTNLYRTKYKKNVIFKFRLPTEQEWELAASNGLDKTQHKYGIESQLTISYKVNSKASTFLADMVQSDKDESQISRDIVVTGVINDVPFNVKRNLPYFLKFQTPYYTYSFYRNDYGIYNMIGNVAEMIDQRGIAKGGSFRDELSRSGITDKRNYDNPADDIGFRCICEVE